MLVRREAGVYRIDLVLFSLQFWGVSEWGEVNNKPLAEGCSDVGECAKSNTKYDKEQVLENIKNSMMELD